MDNKDKMGRKLNMKDLEQVSGGGYNYIHEPFNDLPRETGFVQGIENNNNGGGCGSEPMNGLAPFFDFQ